MKADIELYVSHSISPREGPYGATEQNKRVTRADLRAVAAYLSAMSEEPVEGEVTIGRLQVKIQVGRCVECDGTKRAARSDIPCTHCNGTGREPPDPSPVGWGG